MRRYAYPVAFIVIALAAAHLLADSAYRWQLNSISQLAAQKYERAWVMRGGFIGFGLLIQAIAIMRIRAERGLALREALIMIYGLAILLSAIFSAEPFIEGVAYSAQEAQLHGACATVAGVALTTAILIYALSDRPASRRPGHIIALALVLLFSALFGALPASAGIMQRLLWVAGFSWLLFLDGDARAAGQPAA